MMGECIFVEAIYRDSGKSLTIELFPVQSRIRLGIYFAFSSPYEEREFLAGVLLLNGVGKSDVNPESIEKPIYEFRPLKVVLEVINSSAIQSSYTSPDPCFGDYGNIRGYDYGNYLNNSVRHPDMDYFRNSQNMMIDNYPRMQSLLDLCPQPRVEKKNLYILLL
jgi:hypothetical protein